MKYIDAEKLAKRVEKLIASARQNDWPIAEDYLRRVINIIKDLQQEQPEGIGGVVHHALNTHWIVTDKKQLATVLKEFPEGTEAELFIITTKEVNK